MRWTQGRAGQARCQPVPEGEYFEDLASYEIYQRFLASGYLNNQLSGQPDRTGRQDS